MPKNIQYSVNITKPNEFLFCAKVVNNLIELKTIFVKIFFK